MAGPGFKSSSFDYMWCWFQSTLVPPMGKAFLRCCWFRNKWVFYPWVGCFPPRGCGGPLGPQWLSSVRTDDVALATGHTFLQACNLEPVVHESNTSLEDLHMSLKYVAGWNRGAPGVQRSVTKASSDPRPLMPMILGNVTEPLHISVFSLRIIPAPHKLVWKHKNNVCMTV